MKWVSYAYYDWWIPYGKMSVRMLSSCQNEINSPKIRMKMKQYLMPIVELPQWKCDPDWQHVILFNLRVARHFSDLFFNLKCLCPLFNKSRCLDLKEFCQLWWRHWYSILEFEPNFCKKHFVKQLIQIENKRRLIRFSWQIIWALYPFSSFHKQYPQLLTPNDRFVGN